jgi:hypothetical protein
MLDTNSQKGVSLYITFLIMTILLSIALNMSTLLVSEIKIMREMGKSVTAYYAAETGIERELYENNEVGTNYSGSIGNASYNVSVVAQGIGDCPSHAHYCVKSVGSYKGVKRAIMISK